VFALAWHTPLQQSRWTDEAIGNLGRLTTEVAFRRYGFWSGRM
jgi:hypothetical protein